MAAFNEIKNALTTAGVLAPFDHRKKLYINCDASNLELGGFAYEYYDKKQRVLGYISRTMSDQEVRVLSITQKEMLSITFAVSKYRNFILSVSECIVRTDSRNSMCIFQS